MLKKGYDIFGERLTPRVTMTIIKENNTNKVEPITAPRTKGVPLRGWRINEANMRYSTECPR
ncbi:hypothetical protein D3C73_1537010 [compost metagenome]